VQVYKTKEFGRYAKKEKIDDSSLCDAIARAEVGLTDADLGGGLIKQRVARPGQGRSRGYRTIIAFRTGDRCVFMYGFAKSGKTNLTDAELAIYRRLAAFFLAANRTELLKLQTDGELIKVDCDGD
jgi:hypothetical protein